MDKRMCDRRMAVEQGAAMNQGWQCPVCKTVWAPAVQKCAQCSPAAVPDWTYRPTPYYPWWVHPAPPMRGPVCVTLTTTSSTDKHTYTLYNDPGVSVYEASSL